MSAPDPKAGGSTQRRSKRAKRRLTCSFSIGDQFYRGITVDLSAEGLFIQTDATAAPGSRVEIDLIGTGRAPDVHVVGVIARRRAVPAMLASAVRRGIGVQLIEAPREYGLLLRDRLLDQPISLPAGRSRGERTGRLAPLAPRAGADFDAGKVDAEGLESDSPDRDPAARTRPPSRSAAPPAPVDAGPELTQPDVLLMDDGSLGALSELLAQVGAEGLRIRATRGTSPNAWVRPRRLLVTTASLALSFPWPECRDDAAFVGIAIASDDSQTLSARIARLGFQHLVRRSIHPETLRCLFRQLLYRGHERRRVPRFSLDCEVACGSGLRRQRARLVDLSVRGCRVLVDGELSDLPASVKITLLPDPMQRGLTLRGRVVRRERNPREQGRLSLALVFERPSTRARRRLDALLQLCAEGHVHPPRSRLVLAPFLVPTRRPADPPAPDPDADIAPFGGDLSIAGVHAAALRSGQRFALELFQGPYSEPLRLGAEVFEAEQDGSLGLRFVPAAAKPPRSGRA